MESRDPPKDLHLSQPLTYRHQRIAFQTPSHRMKIPKKSPMFREMEFMSQHFLGLEVLEWTLAKIQWYLLQEWIPPTTTLFMSEFNQAIEVSSFVMELNKDSIQNSASFKVFEGIDLTQDDIKTLTPYYLRKCYFGEAVCMTSSKTCQKQFPWDIDLNTRVCTYIEPRQFAMRVSPNLCSFVFPNHGVYVGSRDHFVMLYDLMEQRYNLRLHCMLERKSNQPTLPPWRIFDRLLKWGDDLLRTIGEEAYPIIYKLEPACISYLVGDLPVGVPNGPTFKAWVRQSLQESNLDDRVLGCADRLFSILDDVHATNPHYTIQCFGMFRIWGHPTVDPLLGVSKLQEISKKVRSFNLDNVVDIDCTFKEEFLRRYIRHHGCWPEVDVSQFPSHNIIRKSYEQGGSFPYNNKLYSRKHLVLLKFKAFFPIDPKFELSELLNDKAGSLPMDELLEAIGHGHCGESTDRSVLVNWLKSYLHDPQQFLQEISENGFPQRECGIGCKGKEKEGKVAARMFSLLSITKRMYIVLTEALLAQHVLKYFPEITMLDDGITLDQKRFAFSKPSENRIRYFTSIDFTKWNSNMRENETLGLFRCFDQMFGLKNCFARTHEMFKESVIYLLDGSYLPPVNATGDGLAEDIGTIHSHLGGLEGLRQKGWTIWTTMLLLKCARGLDVKISLMGQGDNQVIGETYSSTKTEDVALETHYTLLARLNEFLRETGPPLKLSETYTSQKCVMYGKYVIYDGVAVSMSAKKSIKLSKLTNESYSTLESSVSALSATCMSAIESDHSAESIYRMYLMELAMCFQYHLRSSLLRREPMTKMATDYTRINIAKESRVHLNDEMIRRLSYSNIPSFDLLVRLMLCPRVLGGYPILHLYSTIVKGTPDEVVECLSIFKNMHLTANEATRRILVTLASPVLTEHPNYKLLFEHPTALSLAHPPSPADCRRNKVLEYLNGEGSSMIHNPFFKEFLQLASEDNEKNEQLVIRLSAVYPFSPRILSMIYASTPDARARAVIGKIQKTGTLAKLLVRSGENLISIISKAELNHFKGVIRMLYSRGTNEWSPEICSVDFAQKLRRVGWQRDIVGVTIAAPLEIGWIDAPHRVNGCPVGPQIPAEGFVGFSLDALLSHEQLENVGVMGNYAPYRGSCTKSKVSSLGSTLIQHADSLLKKPLQAVSLINWGIAKGGNLAKFVEEVLSTMTDADPSALIPENEAICGSIQHRLQDDRTSHGGSMSLLFNMGTKIGINTSPLVNHCKGSSNTNLMFQTIMVFGVSLTGMALKGRIFPDSTGVHFHLKSNCCIKPADEEPIEALLPIPIDDCIHYNRNSPYLFKPSQHIIQDLVNRLSREPNRGLPKTPQALSDRKAAVVAEECMKMMRMVDFSGEGSLSSPVTINWALGIDGGSWIRNLTLRIISYISLTSPVEDESPQFLGTIAGILAMTDYSHWRKLSNMWFMERMLTQASSPPWYTRVQGNPQFSPNEVGKLIRNWVVAVIHAWRELKDPYLGSFPCYSRPSGPPDQHPGHLMTVRRYILREIDGKKFKKVSLSIRKLLRQIEPEPNTEAVKMIFEGDKFLTAESTDHLAKAAPSHQIVSPEAEPICVRNLAGQGVRLISSPKDHETMTMTDPKTQLDVNMKITAWSHMWKTATGATTAPYKLLDILCTLKIADAPFRGVLCTGDGSGGYTQLCSRLYQNADIYYNTLKIPSISVQQCDPITQLPAFAPYPSLESRVKGIDMVNDGLSDLTHPQYCDAFMHRYHPKQIDLITCDAEGGGWESPIKALKIATTLKKLGVRNKAQFIIMKSYTSSPYLIRTSMTVFLSAYSSVEIYRTPYSSQGNTEVFIVASNLRSEGQLALNIGYPSSEEGKCSVTGPTFSDHEWTKIESKLKRKELYEQQPNTIAALVMTQLMSPHDKEARDDAAVFIELPWAKMGSHICYPNDIVNRLYKFLLPYSEKLSDAGRRGAIKTLKRTVMTCVAAQLLVIWSLAMKNHPDTMDRLQQLFDSGYIVAFKTLNKNYDYSLTLNKITETTLVKRFPLCEIISKANQKVIIKLIGVLESRGTTASITSEYSHSWERGSLDNHGKRLANGRLAMNNEVKRLINHIDPKSPNVPYEQVPQIEGLHPLSIPTLKGYLGD